MSYDDYAKHRKALIDYLHEKVKRADWHGVSDAANDLRELEAEWKGQQHGNR